MAGKTSVDLSLPKARKVRGYTIERMPIGRFLAAARNASAPQTAKAAAAPETRRRGGFCHCFGSEVPVYAPSGEGTGSSRSLSLIMARTSPSCMTAAPLGTTVSFLRLIMTMSMPRGSESSRTCLPAQG